VYILEFERSTDRDEGFQEVKEAEAIEQHKSIIGALRAAAGNMSRLYLWWVTADRLLKATFYTKLKKLHVKEGKKDKLFADHVTQMCKVHHRYKRDGWRKLGKMCTCKNM